MAPPSVSRCMPRRADRGSAVAAAAPLACIKRYQKAYVVELLWRTEPSRISLLRPFKVAAKFRLAD